MFRLVTVGLTTGLMFLSAQAQAGQGGVNDGGACLVTDKTGGLVLKDFISVDPDYIDASPQGDRYTVDQDPALNKLKLTIWDGQFQSLDVRYIQAFQNAEAVLAAWKPYYPNISKTLSEALASMDVHVTSYYVHESAAGCENPAVEHVLFQYQPSLTGPLLSLPRWNKLRLQSQTGGLLKEAFRFLVAHMDGIVMNDPTRPDREILLSRWVSTLVRVQPKAGALDHLVEPGTGFFTDKKGLLATETVLSKCAEIQHVAMLAGENFACEIDPEKSLHEQYLTIARATTSLLSGHWGFWSEEQREALSSLFYDVLNTAGSLEGLLLSRGLQSPSVSKAMIKLKLTLGRVQNAQRISTGQIMIPVTFQDLREYNARPFTGQLFGESASDLANALASYKEGLKELVDAGTFSKAER